TRIERIRFRSFPSLALMTSAHPSPSIKPLHPSSHNETSDLHSSELEEGTPKGKTPDKPIPRCLKDDQLKELARSGELLNIDRAFELFGIGSLYFRQSILVYSLLFLLVDCAFQLVVEMDRKILV
ncbi:hypothetical protein PENTCL1PPCAC_26765, partial [Pristionchus entomophagus]